MRNRHVYAVLILAALAAPAFARGFRGGFRGGFGSVRHFHHAYRPVRYSERLDGSREVRRAEEPARAEREQPHAERHRPIRRPTPRPKYRPGTHVRHLPHGYCRYWWRHRYYYFYDGYWYDDEDEDDDDDGYVVVDAPVGVTVDSIPEGAEKKRIDGKTYYVYFGVWYHAFYAGGQVSYSVVNKPK